MIITVLFIFLGTSLADTSPGGSIARQKCSEYKELVYSLGPSPVLGEPPVRHYDCVISSQPLVIGGTSAGRKEFPHMAAVGFDSGDGHPWKCGGSIISKNFILTAAHCAVHDLWGKAKRVFVGDVNLEGKTRGAKPKTINITARIIHPEYKPPAKYHDIALLRLETDVGFNGWTRPACLHTEPTTGTAKVIATGWGVVAWNDEEGPDHLQKVTLPLVDSQTCKSQWQASDTRGKFPNGVNENWSICAGNASNQDTCQGDSGGPLVIYSPPEYECMYDIVGVTSLGKACGFAYPGVYTRVHHFVPWIESHVWGPA